MRRIAHDVELISARDSGEWMTVLTAVSQIPCVPFDIHKSDWHGRDEDNLMALLSRQARTMFELYGDARSPKIPDA